jgi:hypothetical protein
MLSAPPLTPPGHWLRKFAFKVCRSFTAPAAFQWSMSHLVLKRAPIGSNQEDYAYASFCAHLLRCICIGHSKLFQ